jgi:hypothetical protein
MAEITSLASTGTTMQFGSSPDLENLLLPGNRRCGDLSQSILYGELAKLVPGFSHNWGKNDALAAYSRHLGKIAAEAGQAAISAYLEANK